MLWTANTKTDVTPQKSFEYREWSRRSSFVSFLQLMVLTAFVWGGFVDGTSAQLDFRSRSRRPRPGAVQPRAADAGFNWATYRTSPIDLLIRNSEVFRHGKSGLDADEQQAWQEILDEVVQCRQALRDESPETVTAQWESAFYRFADVRRTAWENGSLLLEPAKPSKKPDPFRTAEDDAAAAEPVLSKLTEYTVITDMLNHSADFVGKPVVMRGVLKRPSSGLDSGRLHPEVAWPLLSGLFPLEGGDTPLAWVQTSRVDRTSGKDLGINAWPGRKMARIPVLVKGWFVKRWGDGRPLIYCESVRELSVQPATSLIQKYAVSQRSLLDEESWLYYETISSMEAIEKLKTADKKRFWQLFPKDNASPQQTADVFLKSRLYGLLTEIDDKYEADKASLEQDHEMRKISTAKYDLELKRLYYLVHERLRRYREAEKNPRQFETYVDLFMNPDVWKGQLVTLRGHVRHVVSYPAKHPEFRGRELHELWLFTDDSQNNPTVVITPNLPADFPAEAELIDQVSVTGCVFKQYVYRGQESRRIAPLVLAGSIQWNPTDSHILSLQESGHLSTGSPLAQRARLVRSQGPSGTALLLVGFVATLFIMVLWGRAQRDRRDRRNLMNRIAERPEFETSLDGQYSPRLADYTSGYDL
jgi:hypothetical protein